jgi:hypothetical protein
MKSIALQQTAMANHQVMMAAPLEIREKYFAEVYATIQMESTNRRMQEEVRQLELMARKKQLEDELKKADVNDAEEQDDNAGMGCNNEAENTDNNNQSLWVQIASRMNNVQASDLLNCSKGTVFACLHNRDSHDFMNESKFVRYILKRTNDIDPPRWDLLHETGAVVVDHIVEDEDQGPSKEWGVYGWYRPPTEDSIREASIGKTDRDAV